MSRLKLLKHQWDSKSTTRTSKIIKELIIYKEYIQSLLKQFTKPIQGSS